MVGRLGQDPELRYTPSGAAVCNFSLATSENWNDKSGQRQEKTEWHRIVVWGKLGEICNQYLAKGKEAFIEGRLQTRSWDDKNGVKKYMTEVNASNVQFLGGRASSTSGQGDEGYQQQSGSGSNPSSNEDFMAQNYDVSNDANFTADDIPF